MLSRAGADPARRARLILGPGWALYHGPLLQNRPHQHHAWQLGVAEQTALQVQTSECRATVQGVIVPPKAVHQLTTAVPAIVLYLDPLARTAAPIAAQCNVISAIEPDAALRIFAAWKLFLEKPDASGPDLSALFQPLPALADRDDARLTRILTWLDHQHASDLRLEVAARQAALSTTRFTHWFSAQAGLPFRAYLKWLKLQRAIAAMASARNLTEAALAGGFADGPHFSRTMMATFGIHPRLLSHCAIQIVKT